MSPHNTGRVSGVCLLPAIAALVAISAGAASPWGKESSDRATLAVAAYNAPSFGREIQLVDLAGHRTRIDPHPPIPLDAAWAPGGKRMAFSGGDGPSYAVEFRNLYTADSRGQNVRLLYAAPTGVKASSWALTPSWSPEGNRLAFTVDGLGPWVVGANGGGAHRAASLSVERGQWAAWSPDGRMLAVPAERLGDKSYANEGVYIVRADGTGLRRITRNQTRQERAAEASIVDVAWSPDGKRISFTRYFSAPADEIDVVDTTGRNESRAGWGDCPVWSPNGGRLAFAATDPRGRNLGIGVVEPGSHTRLIAKQKAASCPVWSADGQRIFFFAEREPYVADVVTGRVRRPSAAERRRVRLAPTAAQVWSTDGKIFEEDGDFDQSHFVVRVLTLHGVAATFRWSDDHDPVWSPDGRQLAFVRLQRTEQIFVLDTVAKRLRRVGAGAEPAWSPDGNWIAYAVKGQIFVVPAAGGTPRLLGKGRHPAWSPDSQIVAATSGGVFLIDRDTRVRRRVDEPQGARCEGASPPNDRPAWSHDGRAIAFTYWTEACQSDEISVVSPDGTNERFIAEGERPQWLPDDSQIVFADDLGRVSVTPAAGGVAQVLLPKFVKSFWLAPDGNLIAYTLDAKEGSGIDLWLMRIDGSDQRLLLENVGEGEQAWRP